MVIWILGWLVSEMTSHVRSMMKQNDVVSIKPFHSFPSFNVPQRIIFGTMKTDLRE